MNQPNYDDYVRDESFIREYLEYQQRYSDEPRESDKVILRHVAEAVADLRQRGIDPIVVDVGCSTGNLLVHLRRALPDVRLAGGEYSEESLTACRGNPMLVGVDLEHMDITDLRAPARFDVAIVNAVLYLMDETQFRRSIDSLARVLHPLGSLIVFDFFHPYQQELSIIETSRSHPDGLPLSFRPMAKVQQVLEGAGFSEVRFEPFEIPIDLQPGTTFGPNASGFEDLNSYTTRAKDGRRLLFRGALYQPWCHLVARRRDG